MREIIKFKKGEFTNFKGETQKFIVCAYVRDIEAVIENEDKSLGLATRQLLIGHSICNSEDSFNESIGRTIALGRAQSNSDKTIIASISGLISEPLIDAVLEREVGFIAQNPGIFIASYEEERKAWEKEQQRLKEIQGLSAEEVAVFEAMKHGVDVDKLKELL